MKADESLLDLHRVQTNYWALQEYRKEIGNIMDGKRIHKGRAHRVERAWPVKKHALYHGQFAGTMVMYVSTLHYAPGIGYWGCIKDNHKNLLMTTDTYHLAETVRELFYEFMDRIKKEELH